MRRPASNSVNGVAPLRSEGKFTNRNLFADNYLRNHLPQLLDWRRLRGLEEAFEAVKAIYQARAASLETANEAQTERDFIQPVLDILWGEQDPGDCYQVQARIPSLNGGRQPDYAFFRSGTDRTTADALRGAMEYWREAPCLGDAKAWSSSLDRNRGDNENPSAQIANYLYRSRVRWGILTNGRHWRLYEREKSSPGGVYFQVDLLDAIQREDMEVFRYLWAFFRRAAFLPDDDGTSLLEKVLQGSIDYATEVGDRLKDSVYDALRLIMNGFLRDPANQLDPANPDHVKLAHDNGLILLYRLLFLLYAEDKELLPLQEPVYEDHSLRSIHREINYKLIHGRTYYAGEHSFWRRVLELFDIIDNGFRDGDEVIVPAYNGGLFSAARFPHLAHARQESVNRWEIGDGFLCPAIDMLSYRRERWDVPTTQDIDYNSLDVQHLGSIYEGLLELKPAVAEVPLVEVVKDGKPTFKPQAEIADQPRVRGQNPRRINAGDAYLATDRGERKATGSYYTPKYIVDYIVENTVEPLVDAAARKVEEMLPAVEREVARIEEGLRQWEDKARSQPELAGQVAGFKKQIDDARSKLLEPYFALRILDPAMGSGHFLVGAADFLSMAIATDPNIAAPDEIGEDEAQPYYKRMVVERCLYGVDLNPLAVELAKLSLWLHTVSKDKALSFLDHHFRCGNSLIGASVDDLARQPPRLDARGRIIDSGDGQLVLGFSEALTAGHLQYLLDSFREIVESPSGELESERHKAELYAALDSARDRYRAVANCWLAPFFGAPVTASDYGSAVNALRNPADWPELEAREWFQQAQQVAREKCFFHWELEFPEQFFTPRGLKPEAERGFDAVIANPPYLRIQTLNQADPRSVSYYNARFASVGGNYDIYGLFVERGWQSLLPKGTLGFILPHKFFQADYGAGLRRWLSEQQAVRGIVNFGSGQVFPEATTYTCLLFLSGSQREDFAYAEPEVPWDISVNGGPETVRHAATELSDKAWSFAPRSVRDLRAKLGKHAARLGDVAARIFQGLKTSADGIYILDVRADLGDKLLVYSPRREAEYTLEKALLKPLVKGGDCKRYDLRSSTRVILFPYRKGGSDQIELVTEDHMRAQFPLTHAYLLDNKADLEARERGALAGRPYYAYGRTQALSVVGVPKIMTPDFAPSASFCYDETGEQYFTGGAAGGYGILIDPPLSPLYILSLLNSRAVDRVLRSASTVFRGGWYSYEDRFISNLPIRRIEFTTPSADRASQSEHFAALIAAGDHEDALAFVADQLAQQPERADVVHDALAHLARRMIDLNRAKREETTGFLAWLERYVGRPVDQLTQKSKLANYHEHDLDAIIDILKQNRTRITVNPSSRTVQEEVSREFQASVSKLAPIKDEIAAADKLIDQIVYKLYGLTGDEIAVVESG